MAAYYLNRAVIARGRGASAVASAAYRHGAQMKNELTGDTRNYTGKADEVVHKEIILPADAPQWAIDRYAGEDVTAASEVLWNDIEQRESQHKRAATSQLAQSYTIALPRELSREQNVALLNEFVASNLVSSGCVSIPE